ncbi:MAG TPA: cytidine/deoxycytidylate deaminase family protein [Symbiobacteriaceae bacterium]|nr:cytidine/deoxycytidylate deaminase family protein [Symbiobacteriaceae bacterium]
MPRPSWDEYFMELAQVVAKRSTCNRRSVGAVLVREKRILTTGYNGSPPGLPHCIDAGCLMVDNHCVRAIHAEQNAIIQAALHGIDLRGSTCYVTSSPCVHCSKMLIAAGIKRVVFLEAYTEELGQQMAREAGVILERFERKEEKA